MKKFNGIIGLALMLILVLTALAQQSPRKSPEREVSQSDLWVGRTHYEDDLILDNFGGTFGPNTDKANSFITVNESRNGLLPNEYKLYDNYPNPFNPSTKIKYTIPEKGFVTISVYDITGKELNVLESSQKDAGSYEVTFDAASFASGLYFCRISVNNFTDVKKMVLIK